MNKKMSKRQRDIKSKLMGAVCMLLVSSIMMVSTTYAWFTLSTAPEVTGITTAVGANGNLEMALLPTNGNANDITSEAGDSALDATVKNITWGNLVDLSNNDFYGLDEIKLYPAALNAASEDANKNPLTLADLMLKTPTYGADGRVSDLVANTVTSTYNGTSFPQNDEYGVRAVGTASGMTDRQLAYRNAKSAANTAMAQAKTAASTSLNTNGSSLANIALSHGVDANATHSQTDVTALLAIVNDLLGTDDSTGALQYIETAYWNYIVAYGASKAAVTAGLSDEAFATFKANITGADDVYAAADLCTANGVTLPDTVIDPLEELEATREKVESAYDDLIIMQAYGDVTINWSNTTTGETTTLGISTPLYKLANTDAMQINGHAASTVKQNMNAIISSVTNQGLNVVIATEGGVYADVADHCGDFNAAIEIARVEYNGLVLENMPATMKTATTVTPVYLEDLAAAVTRAESPDSADGTTMPLTDMYGYIVDLAFRTNAAESNLLLQVDAANRIYSEGGSEETMGNGSTMTFTSTTSSFTLDQLKALMKAIRIVFFEPGNKNVLATAMLDVDNGTVSGGNTVEAKMYLYKLSAQGDTSYQATTYDEDENDVTYYVQRTTYTQVTDAANAQVQLYVSDGSGGYTTATYDEEAADVTYYQKNTEYQTTATAGVDAASTDELLYVQVVSDGGATRINDNVITALTQNTATAVSVLVYLDGNNVGNDDVAATAATSMTGTMNLQFASSAQLVPMEYTSLMDQTSGSAAESSSESAGN